MSSAAALDGPLPRRWLRGSERRYDRLVVNLNYQDLTAPLQGIDGGATNIDYYRI